MKKLLPTIALVIFGSHFPFAQGYPSDHPLVVQVAKRMSSLQIAKCRSVSSTIAFVGLTLKNKQYERIGNDTLEIFNAVSIAKHGSQATARTFEKNNSEFLKFDDEMSKKANVDSSVARENEICQRLLKEASS